MYLTATMGLIPQVQARVVQDGHPNRNLFCKDPTTGERWHLESRKFAQWVRLYMVIAKI